jgi:hypothetical protein
MLSICVRAACVFCLAAAAVCAAACGWTARDHFLQSRQLVIPAQAGDGSRLDDGTRVSSHPGD